MAGQAELQVSVASVESSVTNAKNELTAAIQRLEAKVAAGQADLQPEIDRLTAVGQALDAIATDAKTRGL